MSAEEVAHATGVVGATTWRPTADCLKKEPRGRGARDAACDDMITS